MSGSTPIAAFEARSTKCHEPTTNRLVAKGYFEPEADVFERSIHVV